MGVALRQHQPPPLAVDLDHLKAHLAPHQRREPALAFVLGHAARQIADVRDGHKGLHVAELHDQAAAVVAGDGAFPQFADRHQALGREPIFLLPALVDRDAQVAVFVFRLDDDHRHFLVDLKLHAFLAQLLQLGARNHPIAFEAQVYNHALGIQCDDST